jgi:dTDP-4-dehydrorhamnose 3,5-epimerase
VSREPAAAVPDIRGGDALVPKRSAVDAGGTLRQEPIDGVVFRPARPVAHEAGYATEVLRSDWPGFGRPGQTYITTTLPGRIRAWGLHRHSTDHLFVAAGLVKIVVFDGRGGSPTLGRINEFTLSERNPGLVGIPPNLHHGWHNIGDGECIIISMPERLYDYEGPDTLFLAWDCEAAREIIPYRW